MRVVAHDNAFVAHKREVKIAGPGPDHAEQNARSHIKTDAERVVWHRNNTLRHGDNLGSVRQLFCRI